MASIVAEESIAEGQSREELNELQYYADNFDRLCRLCLSEERLVSLYSNVRGRNVYYVRHFVKFALDLLSVKINKHDGLPNFLCKRCERNLYILANFKQKCDKSLTILQRVRDNLLKHEAVNNGGVEKEHEGHRKRRGKRRTKSTRLNFEKILRKLPPEIEVGKLNTLKNGRLVQESVPLEIFPQEEHVFTGTETVPRRYSASRSGESAESNAFNSEHLEQETATIDMSAQEEDVLGSSYSLEQEPEIAHRQLSATQYEDSVELIVVKNEHLEQDQVNIDLCAEEPHGFDDTRNDEGHDHNLNQNEASRGSESENILETLKEEEEFLELLEVSNKICKPRDKKKSHVRTRASGREESNPAKLANKEKIVCSICGVMVNNIKSHLVIHNDIRPHQCDQCQKSFTSRNKLQSHTNSVHLRKRDFKCDVCGKAFLEKNNLKGHMRIHNGERKYKCDLCPKTFLFAGTLRCHKLTHSQEKKHECPICGKLFLMRTTLNKHVYVHTGERPHKCDLCDKRFRTSTHMRTHMRTHTGEKPLICRICGMAFAQHKARSVHMKSKHPAELVAMGLIDDKGHLKF